MLTVTIPTLVSVILVFLFIIFFLLISRAKPTQNQVNEMKETGWEIVQQIEQYVQEMEETKREVEAKIEKINELEQRLLQMSSTNVQSTKKQLKKNTSPMPVSSSVTQQKIHIMDLYRSGCESEEIAEQLHLQKGVVDVILNIEKIKKQA